MYRVCKEPFILRVLELHLLLLSITLSFNIVCKSSPPPLKSLLAFTEFGSSKQDQVFTQTAPFLLHKQGHFFNTNCANSFTQTGSFLLHKLRHFFYTNCAISFTQTGSFPLHKLLHFFYTNGAISFTQTAPFVLHKQPHFFFHNEFPSSNTKRHAIYVTASCTLISLLQFTRSHCTQLEIL